MKPSIPGHHGSSSGKGSTAGATRQDEPPTARHRGITRCLGMTAMATGLIVVGLTHAWSGTTQARHAQDDYFCDEIYSVCDENDNGSCLEAHATPGCCDPDCCRIICEIDTICCDTEWDDVCADQARDFCDFLAEECGPARIDCNNNCLGDEVEISFFDASLDCNENGLIDSCEVADGIAEDCNGNGIPDACDLANQDCDQNGLIDSCEVADGTAEDCNENGVPDGCDIATNPGIDCNGNGIIDSCDSEGGFDTDCNGNGTDDREEGLTFCPGDSSIPVDLIVVADPSGSSNGKFGDICEDVFRTAVERLEVDFDVRAAWTSIKDQTPSSGCHDFSIPDGTIVPICGGGFRTINSNEDWGDATSVMTNPYDPELLGGSPLNWQERDAVLILIPASDEGPQDGNGAEACGCADSQSVGNLIQQAIIQNAQVVPMPTEGTPACVYDPGTPESLMSMVATETGGSVVDARSWPDSTSSEQLSADLEAAIRAAIEISPRLVCTNPCPADFDGNGVVDGSDLAMLLGDWGLEGSAYDVTGDGFLDGQDLAVLLGTWGDC